MAKIALVKIHPDLNMALPQLTGDLSRAGHYARMFFFKDYKIEKDYVDAQYTREGSEGVAGVDDYEFEPIYESLAEKLEEYAPHAIGLSVISLSIPEAIKTTAFLRTRFDVPILWGGVGTTLEPEVAIEHADLVCIGEGEDVLIEFANCIHGKPNWRKNTDWRNIEGTWARGIDGEIQKNPKRGLGNLDDIAIPDWTPSKMWYITEDMVKRGKLAQERVSYGDYQIMTQRGCPFSCSFCIESRYQEMFGKKNSLRRRSVDVVIEELVYAKENFNPAMIWFWDDVFTVNPRWLKEFLPRYKEEVGLPFWCYTYPTTHKLELLQQLKEAGCNSITMGIQSGSERILEDVYNRPTPLDRVLEAADEIVEAGINGYFDLITKSNFETEADLRATFEFLVNLPQKMIYMGAGDMKSYPSYAYSRNEVRELGDNILASNFGLDEETYDYYHQLYFVARNPYIDKEEKLRIGSEPMFRSNPALLDQYIHVKLDFDVVLRQMRAGTIAGEYPLDMFPPQTYRHVPLEQMV